MLHLGLHICTHMHSITISGKRDHEFERGGVVYGRVSKEEKEGKSGIIVS